MFGEHFAAVRFGTRVQVHARPRKTVDPFLGASVGLFETTDAVAGRWGVDVGADCGIDFHIGAHWSLGGELAFVLPLTNDRQPDPNAKSVVSYASLLPLLRTAVSF
jgi:hypothetical protein